MRISLLVDESTSGGAIAVLAHSRRDVPGIVRQLEERRVTDPDSFGPVKTIDDLLPPDQEAKLQQEHHEENAKANPPTSSR